ncbi:MAG: alpha/beta hydrolase [Bacteroidia bacterium]|nr:alpha/beta hydrolase [Bacteroidia bacterium]
MRVNLAKTLKYVLLTLGIIILILYIVFRFFMNFSKDDKALEKYFEGNPKQPSYGFYESNGKKIHYACIGEDTLPAIIFIHGSPGTWDAFSRYFKDSTLLNHFRMLSVDRIGYGKSDHEPESSVKMQAELIKPLLDMVPDSLPLILVTHSFGGPIGFRLAMDYPEKIDGMVALAGLADPEKEKRVYWLQKPFRSKWLRWLLPPDMDISNREIVPLKQELYEMVPMWEKIKTPTIVIQGDKDMLVNKTHADFIEKMMPGNLRIIRLPEENHFIPWTQDKLVVESIMEVYGRIQ